MQIQPLHSSASVAAAATSQATSKDRSASNPPISLDIAAALVKEKVGKSEEANADRDAQGGGDGLGQSRNRRSTDQDKLRDPSAAVVDPELTANLPEPPGQLDILG